MYKFDEDKSLDEIKKYIDKTLKHVILNLHSKQRRIYEWRKKY